MADVDVLAPQNIFTPHHHHHHRHHQPHRNPKPNHRRRNSPPRPTKARTQTRPITPPMSGPIRILKRGEDPQPKSVAKPDPVTRVSEPEPVKRVDGFYAGWGFVTSPPPSSVPVPAFFKAGRRNCGGATTAEADDIATGLRRLLNLQ